jgi:hypothetical protein
VNIPNHLDEENRYAPLDFVTAQREVPKLTPPPQPGDPVSRILKKPIPHELGYRAAGGRCQCSSRNQTFGEKYCPAGRRRNPMRHEHSQHTAPLRRRRAGRARTPLEAFVAAKAQAERTGAIADGIAAGRAWAAFLAAFVK